jgi:hypothetical protein
MFSVFESSGKVKQLSFKRESVGGRWVCLWAKNRKRAKNRKGRNELKVKLNE